MQELELVNQSMKNNGVGFIGTGGGTNFNGASDSDSKEKDIIHYNNIGIKQY